MVTKIKTAILNDFPKKWAYPIVDWKSLALLQHESQNLDRFGYQTPLIFYFGWCAFLLPTSNTQIAKHFIH